MMLLRLLRKLWHPASGIALYFILAAVGIHYVFHVEIAPCSAKRLNAKEHLYTCEITTNVSGTAVLGIGVDDIIRSMTLNGETVDLAPIKKRYGQPVLNDLWHGYPFALELRAGSNELIVRGKNIGGPDGIRVGSAITWNAYFWVFALIVVPGTLLFWKIAFAWFREPKKPRIPAWVAPIAIIILGTLLRLHLAESLPSWMYQHDYDGHVDAITFYAENPEVTPQPDKKLQFPQQPLYYLAAGVIYNQTDASANKEARLHPVRLFSVALGTGTMLFGWLLVRLITRRQLIINLFMGFLAFTPMFIFQGAMISNDPFNMFMGAASIYFAARYFYKPSGWAYAFAVLSILAALASKVSSVLLALFFLIILVYRYVKTQERIVQRQIIVYSVAVLFLFGASFIKAQIPMLGEFRFINSGLFGGQVIPVMDLSYFFSFNWFTLIDVGQASVLHDDAVRFSLPTYFYGTLFFDDHIYTPMYEKGGLFKLSAQLIYLLGAIYLIGWGAYLYWYRRLDFLQKLLILPVVINVVLIVKLLHDYWNVCNSHFRYFSPSLTAVGLMFAIGLDRLTLRRRMASYALAGVAAVFFGSQIYWTLRLIALVR